MIARMMKVREPAETLAAERANRLRATIAPRVRELDELAVDWKITRPGTRVVCLVGCGKAKSTSPGAVRDLYTSPLFRKSLELAELLGDATFVVSAAKGLLELEERVTPYEVSLRSKPREWRDDWGRLVVNELVAHTIGVPVLRVLLFMGETYSAPIIQTINARRVSCAAWDAPRDMLRGLEIGQRLAYLNLALPIARMRGAK